MFCPSVGIPTPDNDPVWKCVCTVSGYHKRDIYDISWSSSGMIATAGGDNAIRIFKEVCRQHHMYVHVSVMNVDTVSVYFTQSTVSPDQNQPNFDLVWEDLQVCTMLSFTSLMHP